ncbi:MAG: chemotaxis protein CheB [Holophaga sp.]|nr:chemotaxis protein CheB [Holophaga sp.]
MKPNSAAVAFPMVGIGASAGGLEALEKFLAHVPADSGLAFAVIQHLDPTVEDLLPELLQRITPMAVLQARDQVVVCPNCVYVIPPNKNMALREGRLHLSAPQAARGMRLPIDFFFLSLAEDQQARSIGVVLSGMGTDGCAGLRAIKQRGGLGLAQDPAGARFDSMPRAVIAAGLTDAVAPAELLPLKILAFIHQMPGYPEPAAAQVSDEQALEQVVQLLRKRTGQEFSLYKRNTVIRRIERRMGVHQLATIQGYVRFLEANPGELELLFKELLIGVTSFLRDPALWQTLREEVLPALLRDRPKGWTFRAWVPGCSTGEEAYGLAITFQEALAQAHPARPGTLQIFATDLDRDAITRARQGLFKADLAADLGQERLDRYFIREEEGYRVRKEIREMVVFAPQNLIMDPPFTRLDLLSCRNLLIYLSPELQKKLMLLFHYSLIPGGILCLGNSESVGANTDLFASWAPKSHLYRRCETRPSRALTFPPSFALNRPGASTEPKMAEMVPNLSALADQVLLQQFAPPAVLVNEAGDILYISGRTGKYLEPAAGKANWNIYAMARDGLRMELAGALHRALRQDTAVAVSGLKVGTNGGTQMVALTVQQLAAPGPLQGLIMVVFRDLPTPPPGAVAPKGGAASGRVKELEGELNLSREALHDLQQEMQTSQEELKSTNEELQSTNEELQSTNEELTTSKEELQSLNEELQTINAEQQARMEELARTSSDMKNLLDSTNIATVFLDQDLKVGRFTSGASQLYQLLPGDVGRPLTDITTTLGYPRLPEDAREVLRTLVPTEKTVTSQDGRWFSVRIMPYRTQDNRIDGLVLTFNETTTAKLLERDLRATAGQFQAFLDRLAMGYALCATGPGLGVDGQLVKVNRAFNRMFSPAPGARSLLEVLPALGPALGEALEKKLLNGEIRVLEPYLAVGGISYEVTIFHPAPDHFACVFRDSAQPGHLFEEPASGECHENAEPGH